MTAERGAFRDEGAALASATTSVRELRRQRFGLAAGVAVSLHRERSETCYHLQHSECGEFFRLGATEGAFVALLNGERSFAEAISLAARSLGAKAPAEHMAQQLCTRLIDAGLLVVHEGETTRQSAASALSRQRWNPFWMQFPLLNPDRLLTAVLPACRWVFRPAVQWLSLALIAAAVLVLGTEWDRFVVSSRGILSPDNWLWLGGAWLGLKCVHELAHAVACRHYGAAVRELGVVCVLFAPMAYVDVTASWQLRSKWQRIHIAAAGMWAELVIAAVAVLVWQRTESPVLTHRLHNVIVTAGVTTLLFNLNPLMKFDGYYMLSDLLELSNLAQRGAAAVRQLVLRTLFGPRLGWQREAGATGRLLLMYGVAAGLWRWLVSVGLMITAATLWHGVGVVIAAAGLWLWWGRAVLGTAKLLRDIGRDEPARLLRGGLVAVVGGACAAVPLLCPNPRGDTAPGVIDYAEARHVRAPAEGFLAAIHVVPGQPIAAGELLFELANLELQAELDELKIALAECEVRRVAAVNDGRLGEAQIEVSNAAGLELRRQERQRQVAQLRITAPQAGYIVARRLAERAGTFVAAGDELCVIGDDATKEVILAVDQRLSSRLAAGETLTVRTSSGAALTGRLTRLTPRARTIAPHPALSALYGGPLATRESPPESTDSDEAPLVDPVIDARLALEARAAPAAPAGQLCSLSTRRQVERLGPVLWRSTRGWIEARIDAALAEQGEH